MIKGLSISRLIVLIRKKYLLWLGFWSVFTEPNFFWFFSSFSIIFAVTAF